MSEDLNTLLVKKSYATPLISEYGNVKTVTQNFGKKNNAKADGGVPPANDKTS